MAPEVKVREYHPGDEKSVVELMIKVFGGWPHFDIRCSPLDHWKWKYLDNPKRLNAIVVAEEGGIIVGCEHGYFVNVKIGDSLVFAHHGCDSAIDPKFQGEGIYSRLNKFRYTLPQMTRIDYSFWASTNKKMLEFARRRKQLMSLRRLLKMVRINDLDLHFRMNKTDGELFKRLGYSTLRKINKIIIPKRNYVSKDYSINGIEKFGNSHDSFWQKIQPNYKYIVERDSDYLNWRYCDPRAGNYQIVQAEDDGNVLGYCVYRVDKINNDYQVANVMDFITLPGRVDVAQNLLGNVLGRIDDLGVNYVSCWALKGQSNTGVLSEFGYLDSRTPLSIVHHWVKSQVGNTELSASRPNELHIQMGDVDW